MRTHKQGMISRRGFLRGAAAAGVAGAAGCIRRANGARRRPNLIVLMGDDCSARELGCYGHPEHQTPHLDALAADGVMFETCWCTPLCSPTRAEMMTGRYGFRTRWFHNNMKAPEPLSENNLVFSRMLKEAGYATGVSGKWQLFGMPPEYDFDEWFIWAYEDYLPEGVKHTGAYEHPGKPERYWHPCILRNGELVPTKPED
ncbi:MAG: sulfatase-like hydrolase/transferase, partial [Candidatus Hydrogenedentes bacterium]|nr:sulfatase-like hydrolase/transferase [Candidatus Hydrogenedentota bacterium]